MMTKLAQVMCEAEVLYDLRAKSNPTEQRLYDFLSTEMLLQVRGYGGRYKMRDIAVQTGDFLHKA